VQVTGNEPSQLMVALDHLPECPSTAVGQTELVPRRDSCEERRMVHSEQRRNFRCCGQLGVEPIEPVAWPTRPSASTRVRRQPSSTRCQMTTIFPFGRTLIWSKTGWSPGLMRSVQPPLTGGSIYAFD
jgi:hypothetical protein